MSALTKGIQILEAITASRAGLTFSAIVDATGIPKGTAHRLLGELTDLTALTYDEATRCYRGGLLLAHLGASVTANYDVRRIARPHLEALQSRTGNVATLGIRDGEQGVYIDKIEPAGLVIRLHSEIGKSFPLHCTAMGKVLLAYSDTQTIARVTRRKLRAYTQHTITGGKQLREELRDIEQQGFAVDREEITRGLICIAAPIYDLQGNVGAAISSTVSSFDVTPDMLDELAAIVCESARRASFAGVNQPAGKN